MLRVGRDEDVAPDVYAGAGTLLERDDGKPIQEVVQYLLALCGGLLGDSVANLGRRLRTLPLLPICARPPKPPMAAAAPNAMEIAVVYFGRKAGRADRVKADVLVEVEREPIGAHGTMEGDEHLALLGVADALHGADQARALRHEKLLMVVRVIVGREHDQDRAAEPAVDVVGDDPFKYRALEDAIETALIAIEVVSGHAVGLGSALACSEAARRRLRSRTVMTPRKFPRPPGPVPPHASAMTAVVCAGRRHARLPAWAKSIATVSLLMASCACFSIASCFCFASAWACEMFEVCCGALRLSP